MFKRNIMNDIDTLLTLVPDKLEFKNTTSKKFKRDMFNFFNEEKFKNLACLEIGCAAGHTTLILSRLFKNVYAIDNKHSEIANQFCKKNGSNNIEFFNTDVYIDGLPDIEADVILIDAVHTYEAVKMDITNSLKLKSAGKKYFIFDDTGTAPQVLFAVREFCAKNIMRIVTSVGCVPGDNFHRPLYNYEGLICIEL
jgi:protein-L-isoaspartate O-methyltransferase